MVLIGVFVCAAFSQTTPPAGSAEGQQTSPQANTQTEQPSPAPANQSGSPATTPADGKSTPATDPPAKPADKTPVNAPKIPSGSKVYVAPMGGFENYVIAGIVKKKVPIVGVADRSKAEYEIRGSAETEHAGWAKMFFLGSQNSNEQASVNVQEIKTGNMVFAYSVNKLNSVHGKQSAGEAIGKHLNEAIGKD
jgi:hypothetical protein